MSQAPKLGRPASCAPVCRNVAAGSWLMASVCRLRMKHRLVDDLRGLRQQFADPRAALAVLREAELRRGDGKPVLRGGHAGQPLALADRFGQVGVLPLLELRFVSNRSSCDGAPD